MRAKFGPKFFGFLLIQFALTCFVFQVRAADDDPPTRVARLAYAQGSVSFQPAGTNDWVAAELNRPMTTGDKIWSDNDGRVELQLDGSLLRLSQNTGCSFLNLSDNATQVQLTAGILLVRVRRLDENETYEIDTPNLAFSVLRPGLYKIAVNENGDATVVNARSGEGEVTGGGAAYTIHAQDSYVFSGTDQLYATREDRVDQDQFDAWADSRDRRWEKSHRYVSDDVIGYQDFEEYGAWRQTQGYGYVWFPRKTEPDWAPYRYGHWDYIEPWGYTWVDDEPWGFAPFHYGRWVNYEGVWGWVPAPSQGERVAYVRPVYAPALVVWVGGVAGAEVAWFALGPREVYVPSYRVSRNYVERVNVSNTTVNTTVVNNYYNTMVVNNNTTVANINYVNRSVPGAFVATSSQVFTTAQPVARNAVRVDPRAEASARVGPVTPTIAPMKQAVLGAAPAKAQPPAKVETRIVVAKATPPPPPVSFEKRQEAMKNNGGKPLSVAQMRQIEPATARSQPPVKIAPAAKPAATPPPQPPNRMSQPNTAPPANNQPTTAPSNRPEDRPPSASQPKPQPNQPSTPSKTQPKPAERPEERRNTPNNPPSPVRNDRPATVPVHPDDTPPAARTAPPHTPSPNLDKKQQQEQEQLRAQQEQERRRLLQQQEQEHAKAAQQQADQAQKQRMEQQHQQQTQQQQQNHAQEQKQLDQKQQQEKKSQKPEHPPAQQP